MRRLEKLSYALVVLVVASCSGGTNTPDGGIDADAGVGDANGMDTSSEAGPVCGGSMSLLPAWAKSITPATEIYVSPSGNDANDGSSAAKAVQTVAHALTLFKPGVRLNFAAGTYPTGAYLQDFLGSTANPGSIRSSDGPLTAKFQGGFLFSHVKGILVDGIEITTSTGHGFQIDSGSGLATNDLSTDIAIINSSIHDSALANIKTAQSNNLTVIGNTLHNANPGRFNLEFVASSYVTAAGNDGSSAAGFDEIKGGAKDSIIYGNVIHDISSGILVGGNCTGQQFLVDPTIDYEAINLRVWGNVIYNLVGSTAYAFSYVGCQSCTVANNTVYTTQPLEFTIRVLDDGFGDPNNGGACTIPVVTNKLVLRNNIFVAPFKYMVNASADLIGSNALAFDHNAYFTSGADVTTTYTDVPFIGDATSLYNVDPMLVAPPTKLQLGATSKAIGAGVVIGNIPTNASGACWAKPPNMGAY